MSHSRRLLALMAKKRIDESPRKLRGNSTATQLHEHHLDGGAEKPAKKGDVMPNMLIESSPVVLSLTEAANGKLIARGEFGRVGVATQNGRIYPEELMAREIKRLSEDISRRGILGELDHPTDGKTSLKRASHVITGLKIKDGIVIGEAEILNTREGKNLKALIEAQVQIGVSSRGFGSTRPSTDPKLEGEVVQGDFVLKTWDFVADPAVKTAIPGIFTEDVDAEPDDVAQMFLDEFPEIATTLQEDAVEQAKLKISKGVEVVAKETESRIRTEMTEMFERQLAQTLVEAREEISSELREEFEADPSLGASKAILSAIWEMVSPFRADVDELAAADVAKARELEVAEAKESAQKNEERAVRAECMEYIEREIGGHRMAESIRKLVSKHQFTDLEDAKDKLAAILQDLPERTDEGVVSEEEAQLREDNAAMREKMSLLTERVESLDVKLRRAVEVGMEADAQRKDAESRVNEAEAQVVEVTDRVRLAEEQLELAEERLDLEVYKHDRVVGLANGRKLLSLMEGMTSKGVVDQLVTEQGVKEVSEQRLADARRAMQRGVGERQEAEQLNEDKKHTQRREVDDLGNDMSFMKRLAGLAE